MAVKASVDTQNQTTVRVGQQNAIRVSSTSPVISSSDTSTTAVNVVGGRADVTQLAVSGLSTFTGIGTFVSDLYVGGDLYLTDDLVLDNISGSSLDISGISSVGFITATSLYVSGLSTFTGLLTVNGGISCDGGKFVVADTTGNTVIEGSLQVDENATFNGNIVGDDSTNISGINSVTATSFYGDGTGLENTGAVLSAASGSQRLIVSSLNSGVMTTAATDADLTWDSTTNTLSATNVAIAGTLTYEDVTNVDSVGIITAGKGLRVTEGGLVVSSGFSTVGFLTANNVWVSGAVTATSFYGDGTNLTGVAVTGGNNTFANIDVSGITTTSVLKIGTGITASGGIITATSFYGTINSANILRYSSGFTASAGVAVGIDTFPKDSYDSAEYVLYFKLGTDIQSQKLLVMDNGTVAYSNEYALMYHEKQLVDLSCTVSDSNIIVSATPVTGISGALTYVWQRSILSL